MLGPSLGTPSRVWEPQAAGLARDRRVVRWELPGHGGAAPETPADGVSVAWLGEGVLALADALGLERFAYAGISLGGAVGTWLAVHHPERLDSLALLCTSAHFGPPEGWHERAALVRAEGTGAVADSAAGRWFTPDFAVDEAARALVADTRAADPAAYARLCEALAAFDLRAELSRVTVPTLVVAGREDPATPVAHARELADGIPGAGLTEVPGAAHLANVERPGHVLAALRGHLAPTEAPHTGVSDAPAAVPPEHARADFCETGPMPSDPEPYEVSFPGGAGVLTGSLAVPERDGPGVPGVVMVGGSGPSDRHNDAYFPPIRRHLVDAGFAVLSYDKRGVGGSSGDWREASMDDLAADAAAALGFLRTRPGVRADAVGLFGHSEGGWLVLRAAAARDDLPWVVTNSCPGTTPALQERHALATVLRDAAASEQVVDETLALYDRVCEAARRGAGFAEAARLVESAGMPPALDGHWAGMDERMWRFLGRKQDHDPLPDTLRLRCPHLALFGGADPLVPVAESVQLFTTTACAPGRHPAATLTARVFPGADHRVRTDSGTRLAPGYLTFLTRWLTGPS